MAETALDVLSVADARLQLELDDDVPDARVSAAIKPAVNYVQGMTGVPLVDVTPSFNVPKPPPDEPIIIPTIDVKEVQSITYWTPDQKKRETPGGSITDLSTLGRVTRASVELYGYRNSRYINTHETEIWPPEDDWPEILTDTPFMVQVKIGFEITQESQALWKAVVLMARHFYEAPDRIEPDFAVMSLIGPWKRWGRVV